MSDGKIADLSENHYLCPRYIGKRDFLVFEKESEHSTAGSLGTHNTDCAIDSTSSS